MPGKMDSIKNCRQCGSDRLRSWGRIPPSSTFAGQVLRPAIDGGRLFKCDACGVGLRLPALSAERLEKLYTSADATVWPSTKPRIDQMLVLRQLNSEVDSGDILDVGCYDGSLLASVPSRYSRFGVEASNAAAMVARARGVEIIGNSFEDLFMLNKSFDAICAVDVIEHVHNPKRLLSVLSSRLKPGGVVLVSSGNIETPAWNFAGSQYWYCHPPEHISFISPTWARKVASECDLEVTGLEYFAYGGERHSPAEKAVLRRQFYRDAFKSRIKRSLLLPMPGNLRQLAPRTIFGRPGLFDDHILLSFRRLRT